MIKLGMAKIDLEEALRPANPIRERVEAIALYAQSETVRTVWVLLITVKPVVALQTSQLFPSTQLRT